MTTRKPKAKAKAVKACKTCDGTGLISEKKESSWEKIEGPLSPILDTYYGFSFIEVKDCPDCFDSRGEA